MGASARNDARASTLEPFMSFAVAAKKQSARRLIQVSEKMLDLQETLMEELCESSANKLDLLRQHLLTIADSRLKD